MFIYATNIRTQSSSSSCTSQMCISVTTSINENPWLYITMTIQLLFILIYTSNKKDLKKTDGWIIASLSFLITLLGFFLYKYFKFECKCTPDMCACLLGLMGLLSLGLLGLLLGLLGLSGLPLLLLLALALLGLLGLLGGLAGFVNRRNNYLESSNKDKNKDKNKNKSKDKNKDQILDKDNKKDKKKDEKKPQNTEEQEL